MSTTESPPNELPVAEPVIADDGLISSLGIYDAGDEIWSQTDSDSAYAAFQDYLANQQAQGNTATATAFQDAVNPVMTAIQSGEITPTEAGAFFRWLGYNQGLTEFANDATTASIVQNALYQYMAEQGLGNAANPTGSGTGVGVGPGTSTTGTGTTTTPAPSPSPAPIVPKIAPTPLVPNPPPAPVLPTPTIGTQVTQGVVRQIVPQAVTAAGSDTPTAPQVQTAIGIAFADAMSAQAKAIDIMLPGMKPNQVPQALDQLNQAVTVLEYQLDILRDTTTGHADNSLSQLITALQQALATVQATVATLTDQMAETKPSGLSEDLGVVKQKQATDETNIAHLTTEIAGLAPLASVLALQKDVGNLQSQMAGTEPSELHDLATDAGNAADKAQVSADNAQDCCAEQTQNLANDENALGGKSAFPSLKSLAGAAFGLLSLISFLETVEAIANLPLALKGIITDVETISTWVKPAAGFIVDDLTWTKGFGNN